MRTQSHHLKYSGRFYFCLCVFFLNTSEHSCSLFIPRKYSSCCSVVQGQMPRCSLLEHTSGRAKPGPDSCGNWPLIPLHSISEECAGWLAIICTWEGGKPEAGVLIAVKKGQRDMKTSTGMAERVPWIGWREICPCQLLSLTGEPSLGFDRQGAWLSKRELTLKPPTLCSYLPADTPLFLCLHYIALPNHSHPAEYHIFSDGKAWPCLRN